MAKSQEDRDDEINNNFYIPNNFTDSGRVFQGMFELRNVIEAGVFCLILGYILYNFLTVEMKWKIVIMGVTLIPIGGLALIGFQGDSISRFAKTLFLFLRNRRKLRFRRIEKNAKKKDTRTRTKASNKKAKSKAKAKKTRASEKEKGKGNN